LKSDIELLQEFNKGKFEAFDQLVLRHQRDIYFLTLRLAGNEMEAEDLAQKTFIQVFINGHKFKGKSQFKTWLFRIAVNLCKNHLRSRSRKNEFGMEEIDPAGESTSLSSLIAKEKAKELSDLVNKLPTKQRFTVILRIYHELSYRDISRIMSCSLGTAKANFHQAVKKLKAVIEPPGGKLE